MIKIGLTGTLASGKTTVSDLLQDKKYYSLSQIVRDEATIKGIPHTRENLQNLGDELRITHGIGVLAKKTLEKIERNNKNSEFENIIIDGIRNPGEIEVLRQDKNFYLLAVDAPFEARWIRSLGRKRESDPEEKERFRKNDYRDRGFFESKEGQQVEKCIELADYIIWNLGTQNDLEKKFNDFYSAIIGNSIRKPYRPTFEEMFMEIAYAWTARTTCKRRKVGAVLVKDKDIISTGYNGQIPGSPTCNDLGGCLREKYNMPSGQRLELCRAIHAEENAILRASKKGNSTDNTTLYITNQPCSRCFRDIVTAGIKEVVYHNYYPDPLTDETIELSDIKVRRFEGFTPERLRLLFKT